MKNILVTGGAGFIGSFICEELLSKGFKVRILDNLDPQVHQNKKPEYDFLKNVEFIQSDVCNPSIWPEALKDMDAVIHQASAVGVGQSQYQISHYCDVNVMGTARMLDYLANNSHKVKKIVVAASMSSYGEGRYQTPDQKIARPRLRTELDVQKFGWEPRCPDTQKELKALPTIESDIQMPNSIYAINKMTQEDLIHCFGRSYGIPTVALRYFNVFGPRQSLSNPYTGVLAIFTSRLKNNKSPVVYEDGLQTRDFIHVKDIAQANILALESSGAEGESINIGTGIPRTVKSVAQDIAKVLKLSIEPQITNQFRKGDVRHCYASMVKAKEKLGFEPSISFENGLEELSNWSGNVKAQDNFDQAVKELSDRGLV